MAVVASSPCSGNATQSSQHESQSSRLDGTHSSNTSESPETMIFCLYYPDEHDLEYGPGPAQRQMATDLLCIGAAFDSHGDQPGRNCTTVLASTSGVGDRRFEESLRATAQLSTSDWMPIERWLIEDRKDGPFSTIDNIGFADFILVKNPDDFALQSFAVSDFEDTRANGARL